MKEIMNSKLSALIDRESVGMTNPIFVFIGVESYVDMSAFAANMTDPETFFVNANASVFSKDWFTKVLTSLMTANGYRILSLAQFTYLSAYLSEDFFKDRAVIIKDPLRMLLPLDAQTVIDGGFESAADNERSEKLPEYMAELVKVGTDYYYSVRTPMEDFKTVSLFEDTVGLEQAAPEDGFEVLDMLSDTYCLDLFINECIKSGNFNKKVTVKMHKKNTHDKGMIGRLCAANALLRSFGGELCEYVDMPVRSYVPSYETYRLLKKYWGRDAEFRDIKVYENPDRNKTLINVSQGQIVETIIEECKNARKGEKVRDLFLTAPTGAGKSLLFQLPAFYVSEQNDVTIVVSPLIALMKDQVDQLYDNRNFAKSRYINSELNFLQRERILDECRKGEVDLLYMAPELLLSYDISYFIGERKLGLLCVDEAHLISTWGRDFRVDYWFLGSYINKIRRYHNYSFPMVAVTATAIYGGENDMVFETINSLYMNDPHLFIGEVKREDIEFVISNHGAYSGKYNAGKNAETAEFIEDADRMGLKTIVYTPYASQIDDIKTILSEKKCKDSVVTYYGRLTPEQKVFAYRNFKSSDAKIMLSTKAFGMGVDIPDIQVVYHHAPSGLLPDYIQEIGRAARDPRIQGFAALNYSPDDQRYSKMLYGMSSLKHFQLREVLKRIVKKYKTNGKVRNMTFSVDEFSYIFSDAKDLKQKVMTSLMMIEKDYLAKTRFNVIVARPKQMFGTVFVGVSDAGLSALNARYSEHIQVIKQKNDYNVLALDLEGLWKENFSQISFQVVKSLFYRGKLFNDVVITPLTKISLSLSSDCDEAYEKMRNTLKRVKQGLYELADSFFSADSLKAKLGGDVPDGVVDFILAAFSVSESEDTASINPLLQRKKSERLNGYEYKLKDRACSDLAAIDRLFASLFKEHRNATIYRSKEKSNQYLHLGGLMTLLDLGEFETSGGENPVVFVRINAPLRVQRDADYSGYTNKLLENTLARHKSSSELFDYFFMNSFDNATRWNFIEDFFLGASVNELMEAYPSCGGSNDVDIVSLLKEKTGCSCDDCSVDPDDSGSSEGGSGNDDYSPRDNEIYGAHRLLTINGKTQTVQEWENSDPVALMETITAHKLYLKDNYRNLIRRLAKDHYEFLRDTLGLDLEIDFPGRGPVKASIPYQDEPVKFYLWWKKNRDKVTMSVGEKIRLFDKVEELKVGTVLSTDLKQVSNARRRNNSSCIVTA